MLQVFVTENYEDMSVKAAEEIAKQLIEKPNSVLGLATGSTPLGLYEKLIQQKLDFQAVKTFNLDEYVGLAPDHEQSYSYYMWHHFFSKINIEKSNVNIPPGIFTDEQAVTEDYENRIHEAGGIDIQVLGIGHNGHIGFNEPNSSLNACTHIVQLAQQTIQANARFFSSMEEVPKRAITMGMGSILKARKIILLASGEEKAEAINKTLNGNIDTSFPASFLQLHPNVTLIVDKAAAEVPVTPRNLSNRL